MAIDPIFGIVPTGHPVITNPGTAPTPTSFTYALPSSPTTSPISHIVVFLLPGVILPPDSAASIYLAILPPAGPSTDPDFKFLGAIGPGKESALFKITDTGTNTPDDFGKSPMDVEVNGFAPAAAPPGIMVGISLEPAAVVSARITELQLATSASADLSRSTALVRAARPGPTTVVLAQRIIKNAFNFLASFAGNVPVPGGDGSAGVEVVPLKAFQEWWTKFEGKIRNDPGFLERDVD